VLPDPASPYFHRPPPGSGPLAAFAWRALRCWRWKTVLATPVPRKCVIVFYPHTSNWDALVGLFAKWAFAIDVAFAAKDTLFATPAGPFLRRIGGIPVNRREHTGFAEAMRAAFSQRDDLRLVIEPEGTRSYTPHWKSGFYHIAHGAGVPLALGFIDYSRREIGFLGILELTGDRDTDLARIARMYEGRVARYPAQQGPIRLRDRAPG
jgi:1-acyl-sn-glycerol-3-phosphate acyltransferase